MNVPSPWIALLLIACAYRIWRLIAEDTILNPVRFWVVGLPSDWEEGKPIPKGYRMKLAEFISCPACCGFWISLALWGIWQLTPHWTEVFSVPMAISAFVIVFRHKLDPPD